MKIILSNNFENYKKFIKRYPEQRETAISLRLFGITIFDMTIGGHDTLTLTIVNFHFSFFEKPGIIGRGGPRKFRCWSSWKFLMKLINTEVCMNIQFRHFYIFRFFFLPKYNRILHIMFCEQMFNVYLKGEKI